MKWTEMGMVAEADTQVSYFFTKILEPQLINALFSFSTDEHKIYNDNATALGGVSIFRRRSGAPLLY